MKYDIDYKTIGRQIRKKRKDLGFTREYVGDLLYGNTEDGKDHAQTVGNHESGQSFPFKKLLKYCEILDCDLGYLLGEYDEATRDLHFICSATGLTEDAATILIRANRQHKAWMDVADTFSPKTIDALEENKSDVIFIKLINHIIERYEGGCPGITNLPIDYDGDKASSNYFPTTDIVAYLEKVRRFKYISHHKEFQTLKTLREEILKKHYYTSPPTDTEIRQELLNLGYSEEAVRLIQKETRFLDDYDKFDAREKRNDRLVLGELLTRFLSNDFIEGGNDGDN